MSLSWPCQLRTRIRAQKRRSAIRLSLVIAVTTSSVFCLPGFSQTTLTAEYRSQALALSRIPAFVEWPANAFASPDEPFRICGYGKFPFAFFLSELTRVDKAQGRRVEVLWVHKESEMRHCQVLFTSQSEQKNYGKILAALRGAAVLTVGETSDFEESGGMLEFNYENDVLHFEVNLAPANEAHLKISSRFLSLARKVVGSPGPVKG